MTQKSYPSRQRVKGYDAQGRYFTDPESDKYYDDYPLGDSAVKDQLGIYLTTCRTREDVDELFETLDWSLFNEKEKERLRKWAYTQLPEEEEDDDDDE